MVINDSLQIGSCATPVGSIEWFAWLSQHDKFSFQGKNGHFIAQGERRRHKIFWYAYRRRNGKLFKQYLGKSDELSVERLEQASISLAGQNLLEQYADQAAREHPPSVESRIDTSFLPTIKVNLPVLPLHLIKRPRLTRQINTPLILISAPSGFGKSTLLNEWKQTCGHPVAWLMLDEGDNHPLRFWYSIITALQSIHPDFGKELLVYLQTASPIHLPEVVAWLINDIVSTQASFPRFSLVLDDFHHITHPEIFNSIQVWLEHFPPNMQLIISGHTRPALSLGSLRAKEILTELDANDLRFTLEEGIDYLQQHRQEPPLAYNDLEKLIKHAEGWAAGLTLTALALGKQQDRRHFIDTFSGAHIYLREYFMETVLQHSSPDVQTFLLKTAILKHLTGSLCDAVMDQTGSGEMLLHLWQENLFIIRLEEQGWYRYNDLFAEMLLSQLHVRYADEIPQLHQRAAQWYREQYAPADAVYHLLAMDAWEEAASLIETMALRELEQYGEDSRLLRWLQELPEEVVQKHKTLLFVYLQLADGALPKQKIEHFIAHIESNLSSKTALQQTQDEREVLVEIQRIRHTWEQSNFLTLPARSGSENDVKWELLHGLHLLRQGYGADPELVENQMTNLLHRAQAQNNLFVILMVGGTLARRVFVNGQLRRSEKIARQVLEQAILQRGKLPEPASIALAVLSHIHLERNELGLAQRYLTQAQDVDPNPTSTNMIVQTAILRAKIQVAQGKISEALANIQAMRDLHSRRPSGMWADQDLLAYEAMIYIRNGDVLSAEQIINESEDTEENYLSQLVRAEILLEKKQADIAERQLNQLVTQYPSGVLFEPLMDARVQLALAMFEQHKVNQALRVITEAVRLAAPERFFRPFLESNVNCIPLLLLTQKTEKLSTDAQNFIKELLQLAGHGDEYSQAEIEALSTSASISQREQDVLHFLSNGYSNCEVAEKLCISENTVKTHLRNIYDKLGVNSRIQAVKNAKELKLIA